MIIRPEAETDREGIHRLHGEAFPTTAEAELVDRLREQADPFISLVADEEGTVLGHILFTGVELDEQPQLKILGLAPMAVTPARQRTGIGSTLVVAGLEACTRWGAGAVCVLGHPDYYPRFGFVPANRFNLGSEYDVPAEVFMVQELIPAYLRQHGGCLRYHPLFSSL